MSTATIGFLGLGAMGGSIARGISVAKPQLPLLAVDPRFPVEGPVEGIATARWCSSALDLEARSDLLFLCVKPGEMEGLCRGLVGGKKYVSIAAGIPMDRLQAWIPRTETGQIARVMPNLAAQVAQSVSAIYCPDPTLGVEVADLMRAVGFVVTLQKEELMHALTGLSGSGPAFVFAFIHALAEGGTAEGLSYQQALEAAAHTVRGAAELLIRTGEHPARLRNQVTSPGGTTIAGLEELEGRAFHSAVSAAVRAAARRSRELAG